MSPIVPSGSVGMRHKRKALYVVSGGKRNQGAFEAVEALSNTYHILHEAEVAVNLLSVDSCASPC